MSQFTHFLRQYCGEKSCYKAILDFMQLWGKGDGGKGDSGHCARGEAPGRGALLDLHAWEGRIEWKEKGSTTLSDLELLVVILSKGSMDHAFIIKYKWMQ